jgi:peptidoglycan/LPS O-acetylase OafA/YrhL
MTPPRDAGVDALRGLAVLGLVVGHWLVTVAAAPDPVSGVVRLDSPLRTMPFLAPASWVFQTLGLFFLLAGFAAARSWSAAPGSPAGWWWRRVRQLSGPVGVLVAAVTAVAVALTLHGASQSLVRVVVTLSLSPLWFLAVHLGLSAATPLLTRLDARCGARAVVLAAAAALVLAEVTAGTSGAWTAVLAAWWLPWQLGIAMARAPLRRDAAAVLLLAGALAVPALVWAGNLPATAVGLPGAARSNLDPPSAATLALALAQAGAAALACPLLDRAARGRGRAAVRTATRAALPVFLLHQPVLAAVWLATLPVGPLPGLHDLPDSPRWLLARAGWVLVLGAVVAGGLALRWRRPRNPARVYGNRR